MLLLWTGSAFSDQPKSGAYLGASLGIAWGKNDMVEYDHPAGTPNDYTLSARDRSILGGVFAGYNHMLQNGLMIGLEGDLEALNLHRRKILDDGGVPDPDYLQEWNSDWQASARLRLGYKRGSTLFYLTGGLAWADLQQKVFEKDSSTNFEKFSKTLQGWTLGGGIEHKFTDQLSIRASYRHTDFGKVSLIPTISDYDGDYKDVYKVKQDAVRIGLVYGF
jgi:outer membrane immunogenic protein